MDEDTKPEGPKHSAPPAHVWDSRGMNNGSATCKACGVEAAMFPTDEKIPNTSKTLHKQRYKVGDAWQDDLPSCPP